MPNNESFFDSLLFLSVLKTHDLTTRTIEIMQNILISNADNMSESVNNNEDMLVYYIDCLKDFPIEKFQEKIPLNSENQRRVYDRIHFLKCFDLDDLFKITLKTVQFVKSSSFKEEEAEAEAEETAQPIPQIKKILIIINGLDILWDSYSIHGLQQVKKKINDILVRMRSFRNLQEHCVIKTIFAFETIKTPSTGEPTSMNNNNNINDNQNCNVVISVPIGPRTNKRRSVFLLSNYILNFYADGRLS